MPYHSNQAYRLFPVSKQRKLPGPLELLLDLAIIVFRSLSNPRFFKGSRLALHLWFSAKRTAKLQEKGYEDHPRIGKDASILYRYLVELEGGFIKVGQFIATREDLVPKQYVEQLSVLQDAAPPVSMSVVRSVLEAELSEEQRGRLADIEPEPIASASIAQVHKATLTDGQRIVLKIQRPGLRELFLKDLSIVRAYASFFEKHTRWGKNRYWVDLCDEFGKVLFEEIDFRQEGLSAERMRFQLAEEHPEVRIPTVFWNLSSRRVLALEYAPGRKITDRQALSRLGRTPEWVAKTLLDLFFDQVFVHRFFHADPHPGNLAIDELGYLVLHDFGMTYRISSQVQEHFKEAIIALVSRDTDGLIASLKRMDLVRPDADEAPLKKIIQQTTYKYYSGTRFQDLDFEAIKDDINQVVAASPIRMPASLAYVFRAAGIIEGVCRGYDPNFDFLQVVKPYTRRWLAESKRANPFEKLTARFLESMDLPAADGLMEIAKLPGKAQRLLSQMENGELNVPIDMSGLEGKIDDILRITRGIAFLFTGTLAVSSGTYLFQFTDIPAFYGYGLNVVGLVGFANGIRLSLLK